MHCNYIEGNGSGGEGRGKSMFALSYIYIPAVKRHYRMLLGIGAGNSEALVPMM
jgi:hypothetical protein